MILPSSRANFSYSKSPHKIGDCNPEVYCFFLVSLEECFNSLSISSIDGSDDFKSLGYSLESWYSAIPSGSFIWV